MLSFIVRVVMIVVGLLAMADAFLPLSTEQAQVARKTLHFSLNPPSIPLNPARIYFEGGSIGSCSFGYAAYGRLAAGDRVTVERTRLLKSCLSVSRDGEVIESSRFWKPFSFLFGLLVVVVAIFGRSSDSSVSPDWSVEI